MLNARLQTAARRDRALALLGKDAMTPAELREAVEVGTLARLGDGLLGTDEKTVLRGNVFSAAPGATTDPQLRRLLAGASLAEAIEGVFAHRAPAGRLAEIRNHFSLNDNEIPVEMLRVTNAVTPAPSDVQANENAVIPPVFAEGDAAFLRVSQPVVPAGDSVYPILTTRATVTGPVSDSTSAPETTGAFVAETLAPQRMQASFYWLRTDAARFSGMEDSLRMALSSSLSEAMDAQIVKTLVSELTAVATTSQDDFASYRKRAVYDRIDARYAAVESDLRLLVGPATLGHMSAAFRSNQSEATALDSIRAGGTPVRTSAHIPAVGTPTAKQQVMLVRRGGRQDFVAPVWRAVTLIPDEISRADTGEIKATAVLLAAFKTLRTDGFAKVQAQTSA